ncbi:MAG TPA: DUF309 domain-containing protein [Myxococcales bacterium]|nr:DUF309 domain-containing protein [Myxococcales bacterium]
MAIRPDDTPALAAGLALYHAGRYFEAHEVWEDRWRLAVSDERRLLHGLIQLAAAHVQIDRGVGRGAERLLRKAAARLAPLGGSFAGLDLRRLFAEAEERLATSRRS